MWCLYCQHPYINDFPVVAQGNYWLLWVFIYQSVKNKINSVIKSFWTKHMCVKAHLWVSCMKYDFVLKFIRAISLCVVFCFFKHTLKHYKLSINDFYYQQCFSHFLLPFLYVTMLQIFEVSLRLKALLNQWNKSKTIGIQSIIMELC